MPESNDVSNIAQQELAHKIESYPLCLTVRDISEFLGICLTSAYKLVSDESFPKVQMSGVKRIVIPKTKFIEWYLRNDCKKI
jgi:predicted DNA-binding transcriptional regulator AlpA